MLISFISHARIARTAGTLTGGSRNSSSVLTRLHSLMEAEAALAGHQKALAEAEAGLRALAANAAAFKK